MRHGRVAKKFGRSKSHREMLMASLVTNLILRSRIKTTLAKAKQARRDAEKMVTLARKGTLASRRLAAARLRRPLAVQHLFDQVVPAFTGRPGGYTRVVKTHRRRGDGAEMAILECVASVPPAVVDPIPRKAAEDIGKPEEKKDEKAVAAKA